MEDLITLIKGVVDTAAKQALQATRAKVLSEKKKQFDNYGANDWDSEKFPELQPSTVKRKKGSEGGNRPVYRSGRLKNSMKSSSDKDSIGVETNVDYNEYQDGWIKKKGGKHSFSDLSDKEVEGAMESFVTDLAIGIKNGFN